MANETRRVVFDENGEPITSGTEANKTRRVEDIAASGTRRVPEEAPGGTTTTRRPLPLGVLAAGMLLCGHCTVEETLQPHETQRPGLYLCDSSKYGQVIVKIYASNFPPKPELWPRLPFLRHPAVIHTFEVLEFEGHFYEIQEYCAGGTLESRVPTTGAGISAEAAAWITNELLPQISEGLQYLHSQEIIHRDIKPANLYSKFEENIEHYVLADFDISSVLEETKTSRDTQRAGGTWLYTAPEAFPRFVDDHASSRRGRVTRASDYYSLGITLIELLMGATSLHLCQLPDIFDFYLQGGRVEIPQGIPGRLPVLLRGLLIRNRQTRWGAEEVQRWLRDSNSEDDLRRIQEDDYYELSRASRPYRLNARQAYDLPSLAEAMFQEAELATEDLITGDILLNWIGNLNTMVAREIRRDRDKLYMQPDVVLARTIMRCDPTRPFVFADGTEVTDTITWLEHAVQLSRKHGTLTFSTSVLVQELEIWLRLKANPEPEVADQVARIKDLPEAVQLEELAYLFQPDRPFTITQGLVARTPAEYARLSYGRPEDWGKERPRYYEAAYQRWFDGALYAWLRQRNLAVVVTKCENIQKELGAETTAAFEATLRLLDDTLPCSTITFGLADIHQPRAITYGQQRTISIRYTTRGAGVPFGRVTIPAETFGVLIAEPIINQRSGTIDVLIDTRQGMQVNKTYQIPLSLESHNAVLPQPYILIVQVIFSARETWKRIAIGASAGALLCGLPRLIISLLHEPVSGLNWERLQTLWDSIMKAEYPLLGATIAMAVLLVGIFFAIRFWTRMLEHSET